MLKAIYHQLNGFIPNNCAICKKTTKIPLCEDCLASVSRPAIACQQCGKQLFEDTKDKRCLDCIKSPPAFDYCYSIGNYEGILQELIIAAKLKRQASAIAALCYLIDTHIEQFPNKGEATFIQAMPTPQSRLIQRGFNLPQLLVNHLLKNPQMSQLSQADLVKLPFYTQKQATMNLASRQHYQHLFTLKTNLFVTNKKIPSRIIIFDDTLTTGLTTHQLAYLLKTKGFKTIAVWVISRSQLK